MSERVQPRSLSAAAAAGLASWEMHAGWGGLQDRAFWGVGAASSDQSASPWIPTPLSPGPSLTAPPVALLAGPALPLESPVYHKPLVLKYLGELSMLRTFLGS